MSSGGRGILAVWNDCAPGSEGQYEAWYRGEHLQERVGIPGFRAGWRYRAIDAEPEYFTFYETDTPEVLRSQPYLARLNDPTPLTRRIMSGPFIHATRALCTSVARWGTLRGATAVSVRFDARPGGELEARVRELAGRAEVLRAEVWMAVSAEGPAPVSAEQRLRGPDRTIAAGALVETATEPEAAAVAAALRTALGPGARIGTYRLFCALHRVDLDP
ncbi:MAG TPA: hypothetical protein VK878_07735 [Candidatus Deferrimicrobiaceae bacterium]|nr:hypothetical protein [Candidatus Deferrimicrobiaceae bacterium]